MKSGERRSGQNATCSRTRRFYITDNTSHERPPDVVMPTAILGNQYDEVMNPKNTFDDNAAHPKLTLIGFRTR